MRPPVEIHISLPGMPLEGAAVLSLVGLDPVDLVELDPVDLAGLDPVDPTV